MYFNCDVNKSASADLRRLVRPPSSLSKSSDSLRQSAKSRYDAILKHALQTVSSSNKLASRQATRQDIVYASSCNLQAMSLSRIPEDVDDKPQATRVVRPTGKRRKNTLILSQAPFNPIAVSVQRPSNCSFDFLESRRQRLDDSNVSVSLKRRHRSTVVADQPQATRVEQPSVELSTQLRVLASCLNSYQFTDQW